MKKYSEKIPRREFLKKLPLAAAGVATFPTIVPAKVLGRGGSPPPSDKIVMGRDRFRHDGLSQHGGLPQ